jgi:Domain of unknown function (DUF4136)
MKRRLVSIGLLVFSSFLVAAQKVATDRNSTFDFSRFQTFAVKIGTSWGHPALESVAKEAITKRLTEKGWKEADEGSCDALVVIHGAGQDKQTLRSFYEGTPGWSWENVGAPALADSDKYDYKPGTLMVDIFDVKTKRAVFRGVAPNELSGNSEKDAKKIDKAVKTMFKDLPSASSGEKSSK